MKKITTFLLALLLTIPAMAGESNLMVHTWNWTNLNSDTKFLETEVSDVYVIYKPGSFSATTSSGILLKNTSGTWYKHWNTSDKLNADGTIDYYTGGNNNSDVYVGTAGKYYYLTAQVLTGNGYRVYLPAKETRPDIYIDVNEDETKLTFNSTTSCYEASGVEMSNNVEYRLRLKGKYGSSKTEGYLLSLNVTSGSDGTYTLSSDNSNSRSSKFDLETSSYTISFNPENNNLSFVKEVADAPVISNFAASATNVEAGDVVTFSCDVENGDVANVVYLVNGEAIAGNEWTPTEAGEYTISATLENALPQTLTVAVYVKPAINAGEKAVFFDNTNSQWEKVCAYVWNSTGSKVAWPGEECQYLGNNMWKYTCSDFEPNLLIFNNNDNGSQTENLDWVNGGVYSTASKTPYPVILPEGLNIQLTIPTTAYVGDEVTLTSVYTEGYTVKYYVNGVENGETWTPSAAGEYIVAANLMNGSDVVASDEKTVTVKEHTVFYAYLLKEGAWETTNIYSFNPELFGSWPGTALSVTETIEGNEYYKVAFNDVTTVNIIFNDNAGNQTANIDDVTGTAYYRLTSNTGNPCNHEVSTTPFEGAAEPTLFVSGTMNDWGVTDPMTYENGVFTWTGELKGGDEFKFRVAEDWNKGSYGYSEVTFAGEYTVSASASDDNILWTGPDSNVTITVSGDYKTVTIVVNEVTEEPETLVFTVTVPAGTENCYIIGNFAGSDWATPVVMEKVTDLQYTISIEGLYRSTVKYKYLTNAEENLAAGDVWKNEEVADAEDKHVESRNYNEEDVVVKWKGIAAYYPENIVCEKNYYLDTNNLWNTDEAWFAAYFFNKNTDAHTWVKGELLETGYYLFYLSQYNVPAAAPARAKAEEAPVYTHVIFTRMNPAYSVLDWDLTEEVDNGDGSTSTNVLEDRVWNQTADLAYDGGAARTFQVTTADGEGTWISLPTGLEAVEADGMVYAGNVVAAEGAIEVYNLSGAVVARGNNRVDLNGLAGGVYVVRCGNDVLKVVR